MNLLDNEEATENKKAALVQYFVKVSVSNYIELRLNFEIFGYKPNTNTKIASVFAEFFFLAIFVYFREGIM